MKESSGLAAMLFSIRVWCWVCCATLDEGPLWRLFIGSFGTLAVKRGGKDQKARRRDDPNRKQKRKKGKREGARNVRSRG